MGNESDMRVYDFGFDECDQFCYHNYGFASYLDIERIDEPSVCKTRFLYSVFEGVMDFLSYKTLEKRGDNAIWECCSICPI